MAQAGTRIGGLARLRAGWDQITVYLPVILIGLLALGTYWLARNTPVLSTAQERAAPTHDPDSIMRGFSIKTFDAAGRLKTEVYGTEARHYPDTDTLEIDQPRIRSFGEGGAVTVATAAKGISNGDGSEVQLLGHAVVTREASQDARGQARPRLEVRSEFLQVFLDTERVTTRKPVEIQRGQDLLSADGMDFDNITQVLELQGRVHGLLQPKAP
ncbi:MULTISPECIES: LPS export ABC transporter periplasmic protein LptC [Ramlibacter]|uniref:LPS export ABC transporter periplasmic protein LptC n=1 Tax=Ramlibacter aquaticus TaxID=2780094 RepID=A0ABR9SF81_9BURK|nr:MULTISPECIES: LPS export ABC transporter periplasmic protein LptC [Ramlibacter]MBE7941019.1 LPS export ABC transporter periplasmic protein LptC [Ramlibacter aquaticus]